MASKGVKGQLAVFALGLLMIVAACSCFVVSSAPRAVPRGAHVATPFRPEAAPSEPEFSAVRAVPAGILAFVVAAAFAIGSPQPASAGLLSEFGKADYDATSQASVAGMKAYRTKSQAEVLDGALKQAKDSSKKKMVEAIEKQKAEDLFKRLAAAKKVEDTKVLAKAKKQEEIREKVLAQLEKSKAKATPDSSTSKAEAAFASFTSKEKAKEEKLEQKVAKQEQAREKVLFGLERKKQEAATAAKEAEAIAQRIEELAKSARQAAEAAKKNAAALG